MEKESNEIYQLVKDALHTFALEISEKITAIEERVKILEDKIDSSNISADKVSKIPQKQISTVEADTDKFKTSEKDQKELKHR